MSHCFRDIVAKEGYVAVFNGLSLTLAKEGIGHAIYFAAYEWFKQIIRRKNGTEAAVEMDHFASLTAGTS